MNSKGCSFHRCSFLIIQNGNFFSVTQLLELLKRKGIYLSKCALDHTIFPLCHSIFGILYFIWQHYQLPNSLSPFIEVSFTYKTAPPIPAFSPLPLCSRPSSFMPVPLQMTSRRFSCLQSLSSAHCCQDSFLLSHFPD